MRRRLATALLLVGLLTASAGLAACGQEHELDVPEGHQLELGELIYNVQLTRFLNPLDNEDQAYLEGLPAPPEGQLYLGVFIKVDNESDEPATVADELTITDTRDNHFDVLEVDNQFAFEPGAEIDAHGEIPEPNTPAAAGPIKGAMALFLVDEFVTENRPLELEIPGDGETGTVEIDI